MAACFIKQETFWIFVRIQEALMTVQFTFQFNPFNHFAPSVHQQTSTSSSYTCSKFCPWWPSPYNLLVYSVTSLLLEIHELLHLLYVLCPVSCSIHSTQNANSCIHTCQHVWSSECNNYIYSLDQLHSTIYCTFPSSNSSKSPSAHITGCYSTCLIIHSFFSWLSCPRLRFLQNWTGCKPDKQSGPKTCPYDPIRLYQPHNSWFFLKFQHSAPRYTLITLLELDVYSVCPENDYYLLTPMEWAWGNPCLLILWKTDHTLQLFIKGMHEQYQCSCWNNISNTLEYDWTHQYLKILFYPYMCCTLVVPRESPENTITLVNFSLHRRVIW